MIHPPSNPFASPANPKPSCRDMLQIILDGESTHEQHTYFRQHIDHCRSCFQAYELDMAIKEMLKKKCCSAAPAGLAEEIKNKVNGQYHP
jgi:mycothiol system anti-sigma-R factor